MLHRKGNNVFGVMLNKCELLRLPRQKSNSGQKELIVTSVIIKQCVSFHMLLNWLYLTWVSQPFAISTLWIAYCP